MLAPIPPELHLLKLTTFGATPAELERLRSAGAAVWLEEQLDPEGIDDSTVEWKVAQRWPTLRESGCQLDRARHAADQRCFTSTPQSSTFSKVAATVNCSKDGVYSCFSSFGHCQTNGRAGEGRAATEPTFAAAPQLRPSWEGPANYRTDLGGQDARSYDMLSLRVGVSHGDTANAGGQDFDIVFRARGCGPRSRPRQCAFRLAGQYLLQRGRGKTTLNAVQAPLSLFHGVDLARLSVLEHRFGGTPAGTIQLSDLLLRRL